MTSLHSQADLLSRCLESPVRMVDIKGVHAEVEGVQEVAVCCSRDFESAKNLHENSCGMPSFSLYSREIFVQFDVDFGLIVLEATFDLQFIYLLQEIEPPTLPLRELGTSLRSARSAR